ncbi:MAG: FAD:protein FMN transferase [Chlorobi bacterium]|nr:FAD:protein FMN transferase [Chlorobiota bacterium]
MNRNQILSIVAILLLVGLFFFKSIYNKVPYISNSGYIQGTTYHITYQTKKDYQYQIDSILHQFDLSLSTYVPNSIISRINKSDTAVLIDSFFTTFFNVSMEISAQTNGAFDITVAPLVNAWGFGFTNKSDIDSLLIDSLMKFVGYKKVKLEDAKIIKEFPEIMLDGNAIAQGQSVDVIADFFNKLNINNYLIDIGGELRSKGINPEGNIWRIGIDQPIENSDEYNRQLQAVIDVSNKALATSGNYRKFYIKDGIKYAHTIDPKSGYPVIHNLLSATVVTNKCIYADAYATAFMVMGVEKSKQFLDKYKSIDAYLIYTDSTGNYKTYITNGLKELIEKP